MPAGGRSPEEARDRALRRVVPRQPIQAAENEEHAGVPGATTGLHRAGPRGQEDGGHQVRLGWAGMGSAWQNRITISRSPQSVTGEA